MQQFNKTIVWFGPAERTDIWQPVDAGYAQAVKQQISYQQEMWLMKEDNLALWETDVKGEKLTASDRRILLTIWTDAAVQTVNSRLDEIRGYFLSTGCLITIDGSGDDLILPKYNYSICRTSNENDIIDIDKMQQEIAAAEEPEDKVDSSTDESEISDSDETINLDSKSLEDTPEFLDPLESEDTKEESSESQECSDTDDGGSESSSSDETPLVVTRKRKLINYRTLHNVGKQ
eukprot:Pompholyxophrys_punicea_v1_NODE_217_length_2716_cov_10.781661.p1 type:complete len:233 gc:universal NODE_217_length_2716_cov_10.781661:687-1385(+)